MCVKSPCPTWPPAHMSPERVTSPIPGGSLGGWRPPWAPDGRAMGEAPPNGVKVGGTGPPFAGRPASSDRVTPERATWLLLYCARIRTPLGDRIADASARLMGPLGGRCGTLGDTPPRRDRAKGPTASPLTAPRTLAELRAAAHTLIRAHRVSGQGWARAALPANPRLPGDS